MGRRVARAEISFDFDDPPGASSQFGFPRQPLA